MTVEPHCPRCFASDPLIGDGEPGAVVPGDAGDMALCERCEWDGPAEDCLNVAPPMCPRCGGAGGDLDYENWTAWCDGCATMVPTPDALAYAADPQRFMVCLDGGDPTQTGFCGPVADGSCDGLREHEALAAARELRKVYGDAVVSIILEVVR